MPSFDVKITPNPRAQAIVRSWSYGLVKRVVATMAKEIRRVLDVPYPPASRGGEAPHKRTGTLQRSVVDVFDKSSGTGYVEIGAPYASYLEKGTKHMHRRPFALNTARRVLGWLRFAGTSYTASRTVNEE